MEQQSPASLRERQIAKLVQNDQIHLHQAQCQPSLFASSLLLLQHISQIHGRVEAHPFAVILNACDTNCSCQMGLTGTGSTGQHQILLSRVNYLGRFGDNYDGRLSLLASS